MKILVRSLENVNYVWKDATYEDSDFYVEVDDIKVRIDQTKILAIQDDNRRDAVQCNHCGAIIKNTPEAIEAHFKSQEDKRNCFGCNYLRKYVDKSVSSDYSANEDGTYNVTETYVGKLKCGNTYWNLPDISSTRAKEICEFYRCRRLGVRPIQDIFTQYPDPFDKQITVDKLIEKKFERGGYFYGHFEYDLKCRNTVKARVNELGIVDHFVVKHRGNGYKAYYSEKYDKLFFSTNGRDYELNIPSCISQAKYDQAKAKIAALYKEDKSK